MNILNKSPVLKISLWENTFLDAGYVPTVTFHSRGLLGRPDLGKGRTGF